MSRRSQEPRLHALTPSLEHPFPSERGPICALHRCKRSSALTSAIARPLDDSDLSKFRKIKAKGPTCLRGELDKHAASIQRIRPADEQAFRNH